MDLDRKVRDTIKAFGMLEGSGPVIAAVSGGADSMALLHALLSLKDEFFFTVIVCHLNHNLRGEESDRDFAFVRDSARSLGLVFEGKKLGGGVLEKGEGSIQEAARAERYAFFEEAARKHGARRVALGHTLDDQAETVLMRVIKGSSLSGLAGMPPVRGLYIRPLIETSRVEIEAFLREKGIGWVDDSSNSTEKYLRNSVRLSLLPYIRKRYNRNINETLSRLSMLLSRDEDFIAGEATSVMDRVVLEEGEDSVVLGRKALLRLHEAVSSRVFLGAARKLGADENIYGVHVEAFFSILRGASPNASIALPGGLTVRREYEKIIVSREAHAGTEPFHAVLRVPGETTVEKTPYLFKATVLKKPPKDLGGNKGVAYFDYEAISGAGPLEIRPMRPGDRISPFGMNGSKKIKNLFIDLKLPLKVRRVTPILVSGGEVLWVAGIRRSSLYGVSEETERVLRVEFITSRVSS